MPIDSVANLTELLRHSRLLEPAQLEELTRDLQARFPQPKALAAELLRRGWLTAYQINQLFQGRGGGLVLGSYVLLERLGEGGMGQVFKARNWKLGQVVALKVVRHDRLTSPDAVRRFRREIRAAAQLDHPHIVHALDADQAGDVHFFVMEYVEGSNLAQLVRANGPLPIALACDYVRQAAVGLQHAHERGLVHRDIKPSNLLVTGVRGPGSGVSGGPSSLTPDPCPLTPFVKVLDMGLARLETADSDTSTSMTETGVMMGSPDYMAPEQARDAHSADIRSDLYSLGCTFYHLLGGRVPFPKGTVTEKLLMHLLDEPTPIEVLRSDVPPPVAAVVRKLMAKRPADRYQTPAELVRALAPLAGQRPAPAPAAPMAQPAPTPASPFADLLDTEPPEKTVLEPAPSGRRRLLLAGTAAALVGLAALGVLVAMWLRPTGPPSSGEPPLISVRVEADRMWQDTGVDVQEGSLVAVSIRQQWQKKGMQPCWGSGDDKAPRDRAVLLEAPLMCVLARVGDQGPPVPLPLEGTFRPAAGGRLFVQANDLDLAGNSGRLELRLRGATKATGAAPAPGLSRVQAAEAALTPFADREADPKADRERLRADLLAFLRDHVGLPQALRAAELLMRLPSPLDRLDPSKVSPEESATAGDGDPTKAPPGLVAVLGDGRLRQWDTVYAVAFHPDGKRLASGGRDGLVLLWDADTGRKVRTFRGHGGQVNGVAFRHDGKQMASAGQDAMVKVWDVDSGKELLTLKGHGDQVFCVAYSPDGKLLASGGNDQTVRVWDVHSGKELRTLKKHASPVHSVAFSKDGRRLAGAFLEKVVQVWDAASGGEVVTIQDYPNRAYGIAFNPDGRRLAIAAVDGLVRVHDVDGGKEVLVLKGVTEPLRSVAYSPDGRRLAAGGDNGTLRVWDTASGETLFAPRTEGRPVLGVAFDPEGRRLATGNDRGAIRLWDLSTGRELLPRTGHEPPARPVAASPDGTRIASGGGEAQVRVWDAATGREAALLAHSASVLAFSPDGKRLFSHGSDEKARVLDAADGKVLLLLGDPSSAFVRMASSADGRRVATCDKKDETVRVWDAADGKELLTLKGHGRSVHAIALSPDGKRLAAGSADGGLVVWDAATGQELLRAEELHGGPIQSLVFSPDGKRLATTANDNKVNVLDATTGRAALVLQDGHDVRYVAFRADGKALASAGQNGRVVLWDGATGARLREWQLAGAVGDITFTSDGRHLLTANGNGTLYVLRLSAPPDRPPR